MALAALLGGCGSGTPSAGPSADPDVSAAETTGPTQSPDPDVSAAETTGPTQSPDPAPLPQSADGASFGVDRFAWPASMDAARTLLGAMPEDLGGEPRDHMPAQAHGEEELAVLSYGGGRIVLVVSDGTFTGAPGTAPEAAGAPAKLAAMFSVMYACDMATYAGSIQPNANYPGPGFPEVDPAAPAWFACRVAGAEGADEFSAQAVGWTSADQVAWLALGPDDAAVGALVTAMQEAAA